MEKVYNGSKIEESRERISENVAEHFLNFHLIP